MRITDTLAFVRGAWRIERSLTDHRTGRRGTFHGGAVFTSTDTGTALRYQERGELHWGQHASPAGRSLLWTARADGAADVSFADGRPFHRVDLRTGSWEAGHRCGQDDYRIAYRVLGPGLLEERWRVRGPRKDYDALSRLTRRGPAEEHGL